MLCVLPAGCVDAPSTASRAAAPGDTTTVRRSAPALETVPSVAAMMAVSAAKRRSATVATPFSNVTAVAVPNRRPATSGAVPFGADEAPENWSDFRPV